jgi:hypothetical protein
MSRIPSTPSAAPLAGWLSLTQQSHELAGGWVAVVRLAQVNQSDPCKSEVYGSADPDPYHQNVTDPQLWLSLTQ